jgi:hypothetical protein
VRIALRSSLNVFVCRACHSWCVVNVDGKKKKVIKKQRRSKVKGLAEKVSLCGLNIHGGAGMFGWQGIIKGNFSGGAIITNPEKF